MTPATALLWKEWRELRWFLITGLGVFLGLPLIGAIEGHLLQRVKFEFSATGWVVALGGILAVFTAVGATCRDLSHPLVDFWRSRPISIGRCLAVKYLSGLALVLLLCTLPPALEIGLNRPRDLMFADTPRFMVCHGFAVAAIFSMAFLLGCLVRRIAQAAMLGLAAMLLIYFLPYVLPPLNWLSLPLMLQDSDPSAQQCILYALGMLGMSTICAIAAWQVVRRDWCVQPDRKLMYWSIGLAAMLLVWSAAYQIGSNLPLEQELALPGMGQDSPLSWTDGSIAISGKRGVLWEQRLSPGDFDAPPPKFAVHFWPLEIQPSGVKLLTPFTLTPSWDLPYTDAVVLSANGEYAYVLGAERAVANANVTLRPELLTIRLNGQGEQPVTSRLELGAPAPYWPMRIRRVGERLLINSPHRLLAVDVADPARPRLLWERNWPNMKSRPQPLTQSRGELSGPMAGILLASAEMAQAEPVHLRLLELEDFSPRQRLEATLWVSGSVWLSGDAVAIEYGSGLAVFRLTKLTDRDASFALAGQNRPTAIQRMVEHYARIVAVQDGLVYVRHDSALAAKGLTVYDIRNPERPRRVGHFAMPAWHWHWTAFAPLPDGRALVAGSKLYVVGKPRIGQHP